MKKEQKNGKKIRETLLFLKNIDYLDTDFLTQDFLKKIFKK